MKIVWVCLVEKQNIIPTGIYNFVKQYKAHRKKKSTLDHLWEVNSHFKDDADNLYSTQWTCDLFKNQINNKSRLLKIST